MLFISNQIIKSVNVMFCERSSCALLLYSVCQVHVYIYYLMNMLTVSLIQIHTLNIYTVQSCVVYMYRLLFIRYGHSRRSAGPVVLGIVYN